MASRLVLPSASLLKHLPEDWGSLRLSCLCLCSYCSSLRGTQLEPTVAMGIACAASKKRVKKEKNLYMRCFVLSILVVLSGALIRQWARAANSCYVFPVWFK